MKEQNNSSMEYVQCYSLPTHTQDFIPKDMIKAIQKTLPNGMPKIMADQIINMSEMEEGRALISKMPPSMFKALSFAPKFAIKNMHKSMLKNIHFCSDGVTTLENIENTFAVKAALEEELVPISKEMEEQLPKDMLDALKQNMPHGLTNDMAKSISDALQNGMFQGFNPVNNPHDVTQYFAREFVDPLAYAFNKKLSVHAGIDGQIVPQDEIQEIMNMLSHTKREGKSVVYIHIPFCETHCLYCGFYLKPYSKDFSKIYTDTLIKEIEMWAGREIYTSSPVHAVYFGGGTPTSLEPSDLERILKAIRTHIYLANDCEITIEGRLHNFDEEKIEACFRGGANRFSLGVQSFDTQIRQKMGRVLDQENVCRRIELLKSYDQAAIIIDLIYGFPMQTMEKWQEDLRIAKSLELDGFDCYQLNIFDSTPLGKMISAGKIEPAADIPKQAYMFKYAIEELDKAFYKRLSMSHFARTTRERNIYNQSAKGIANVLSFGSCAGGGMGGYSYMQHRTVDEWSKAVHAGQKPIMGLQKGDKNSEIYKAISQSIELGYLDIDALEKRYFINIEPHFREILSQWEKTGLITMQGKSFKLNLPGQFWYVNLAQLLLIRAKTLFSGAI